MKSKVFFIVLFSVLFFSLSLTATAGEFAGGSGTEEDPYLVETAEHLDNVRNHLDAHFRQISDIDLSEYADGEGWEPIGSFYDWDDNEPFLGSYNGNDYIITNLFIDRTDTDYVGLFAYVGKDAELNNMALENVEVSGDSNVGGLVGYNNRGNITNSYATGDVSGDSDVGGLVGYNNRGNITNSYATGDVSGDSYVGGLVGNNRNWANITDSYATGHVSGEGVSVGGLVGFNYRGTITDSYATGIVSGEGWQVGGLVGMNFEGAITNSYYDKETTSQDDDGKGIPKTTEEMMQQGTFEGWDFDDTWDIIENETYPFLQWVEFEEPDGTAVRSIEGTEIEIELFPEEEVSAIGVEERIPEGIEPVNISHDGEWNESERQLSWIFSDGYARTLSYEVSGEQGEYTLEGIAMFDIQEVEIEGDSTVVIDPEEPDCSVNVPDRPSGPTSGTIRESLDYSTGGSSCDCGISVEYLFDWDDGNDSDWGDSSASYSWEEEGEYEVRAKARCTESEEESDWSSALSVTIVDIPIDADFTADRTQGNVPLRVEFTDQSTGDIDTWQWDFGDGSESEDQHPIHTYEKSGIYTVELTVIGDEDEDTATTTITVYEPFQAAFTAEPTEGKTPLEVEFTDKSTGDIDSWQWDFGDGTTSIEQNPTHTYEEEGEYTVSLEVSSPEESDKATKEIVVISPEEEYDAEIESYEVPSLHEQHAEEITLTMRNIGTETWKEDSQIRLGAVGNEDDLAPPEHYRIELDHDVEPAQTHTFTIPVYPEEAGTFTTEWQMLKEGEFWFGEKFSKEVEVSVRTGIGSPHWNLFE